MNFAAQMVWLCKEEGASAIITEDSDVLVYCMAANVDVPVLVKMDDAGSVQVIPECDAASSPQLYSSAALWLGCLEGYSP